jgi:hypothetical protein
MFHSLLHQGIGQHGHVMVPGFRKSSHKRNQILIAVKEDNLMLQVATNEQTAPCPKCDTDMVLAAITPHPISVQLARHTYLCAKCNQTKTYILPVIGSESREESNEDPDGSTPLSDVESNRRKDPRAALDTPATIYNKDGSFLSPCVVRDLSRSGGRIELFKEAILPQYFLLSLLPDGSGRRLCSKVWQIALIAGVRFVDK